MAPHIPHSSLTLTYPIYTSSFDPQNSDFLLVAGGGGEGRSGVGNKITLLDTSRREKLSEVHEIELSRDEDSVTSLAVARSTKDSVTAFAGINSSVKEQERGNNEHLRSFKLPYPGVVLKESTSEAPRTEKDSTSSKGKKKKGGQKAQGAPVPSPTPEKPSQGAPQTLGKVGLFRSEAGPKQETYQRVLRFSPSKDGSSKLGAVATGMAATGEVVVFDATKENPTQADIRQRITLQKGEEAADVDILQRGPSEFEVAYCTEYDVCVSTVSTSGKGQATAPVSIYTTPHPTSSKTSKRAAFRALRWLTPRLIVLIQNLPKRSGTEVLLLDVPETRAAGGAIILRKSLHKTANSATALATAFLPQATSTQNAQHVIAIAAADISLTILTVDHAPASNGSLKFKTFAILKDVHSVQMTSLAFSTFVPPEDPSRAGPQYLKLASTSMGATLVVHSMSLMPYPPFAKERARYVLSSPAGKSELRQVGGSVIFTLVVAALAAIVIQAMIEIRGGSPEYLGAKNWLHPSIRDKIAAPYMFGEAPVIASTMPDILEGVRSATVSAASAASNAVAAVSGAAVPLQEALKKMDDAAAAGKGVILRDHESGVAAELHHDEEALKQHGRRWEELEHHERAAWKDRLLKAGNWVEDELETVVKSVFFGELAGVVADAIRG